MDQTLDRIFLEAAHKKLLQLSGRVTDCLGRLSADQIWARGAEHENAVGNLVLHLCGNVRQWIISGVGGELDTRVRDLEFTALGGASAGELAERLKATVES